MNFRTIALLGTMIIPLLTHTNPPAYELQQMPFGSHTNPISDAGFPNVPYQALPIDPNDDLADTVASQSTIRRRVMTLPLPGEGLLMILRACFPFCFGPNNSRESESGDSL